MYGDRFFHEVLDATNSKALKLKSHDIMFQRYYPLQLSDIFEFFAHLLVICCEKNRDNDDVRRFLSKWKKNSQFLDLENFETMPVCKFQFIYFCLDIGEDKKVSHAKNSNFQILDLDQKAF